MQKTPNISTETGNKKAYICSPLLLNVNLEASDSVIRQEHKLKGYQEEEEFEVSMFVDE